MTKYLRGLALAMAMAAMTTTALSVTSLDSIAQEKGKEKEVKKGKEDPKVVAKKAGKIEVKKGKDDKFRFTVRDADNKYLAGSGAFETKEEAIKAIEEFKAIVKDAKVEVVKE